MANEFKARRGITVRGGIVTNIAYISDDYNLLDTDAVILAGINTNKYVSLPSAAGNAGKTYDIINDHGSTAALRLSPSGGETIDGAAALYLHPSYGAEITSDGANWICRMLGASGYSGYSGYSGAPGYSGFSGYSGAGGASGYFGYSGRSGYSGYSGYSGRSGYSGASGASGYTGYSGLEEWSMVSLASDESKTNNTLADAGALNFAVTAGSVYEVFGCILIYVPTATPTSPNYQWRLHSSAATATIYFCTWAIEPGATSFADIADETVSNDTTTRSINSAAALIGIIIFQSRLSCTSNTTISYQHAQVNTVAGTPVYAMAGSYIEYRKVT